MPVGHLEGRFASVYKALFNYIDQWRSVVLYSITKGEYEHHLLHDEVLPRTEAVI